MVYQTTIDKKFSKYSPPESTHAFTRLIMDCDTCKVCECLVRHQKCVDTMSLYFKFMLITLVVLSVPTDKILKDRVNRLLVFISKTVVL
jgi:hypothetical protein